MYSAPSRTSNRSGNRRRGCSGRHGRGRREEKPKNTKHRSLSGLTAVGWLVPAAGYFERMLSLGQPAGFTHALDPDRARGDAVRPIVEEAAPPEGRRGRSHRRNGVDGGPARIRRGVPEYWRMGVPSPHFKHALQGQQRPARGLRLDFDNVHRRARRQIFHGPAKVWQVDAVHGGA